MVCNTLIFGLLQGFQSGHFSTKLELLLFAVLLSLPSFTIKYAVLRGRDPYDSVVKVKIIDTKALVYG